MDPQLAGETAQLAVRREDCVERANDRIVARGDGLYRSALVFAACTSADACVPNGASRIRDRVASTGAP